MLRNLRSSQKTGFLIKSEYYMKLLRLWGGDELSEKNFEFKWNIFLYLLKNNLLANSCKSIFYVSFQNIYQKKQFLHKHQCLLVNKIFRVFLDWFFMFNLYNFIFKNQSGKWLVSTSYGLIIELSRNGKLLKYKIILSQHTNYLHQCLVCLKFWHLYCCLIYFFPAIFQFYRSGPARLPSWLWIINAASVPCDQKRSGKWNLLFLKVVPPNSLPFNLGSPLSIISSLFSQLYLSLNAILHKMLKLVLLNFKTIFLRMHFSFVAAFFSLVLVICILNSFVIF